MADPVAGRARPGARESVETVALTAVCAKSQNAFKFRRCRKAALRINDLTLALKSRREYDRKGVDDGRRSCVGGD
jgi:hypothetical protein